MKRFALIFLSVLLALLTFSNAFAANVTECSTLVNIGDSIAFGKIDNDEIGPGYAELVADYLDADLIQHARIAMQVTDILFLINDEYREAVECGKFDSKESIMSEYNVCFSDDYIDYMMQTIRDADYIMIEAGSNDISTSPSQIIKANKSLKGVGDYLAALAEGIADVKTIYPKLIATLRDLNPDATIIVLGLYIPYSFMDFAVDNGNDANDIKRLVWDTVDLLNMDIKNTCRQYDCVYVEMQGVQCINHPTVLGYTQVADRIVAALNSDMSFCDLQPDSFLYREYKNHYDRGLLRNPAMTIIANNSFYSRSFVSSILYNFSGSMDLNGLKEPFFDTRN